MSIKNKFILKHKLRQAGFVILAFLIPTLIFAFIKSEVQFFPLGRSIVASILLGLTVSFFELVISSNIIKKVKYRTILILSFTYYYITYSFIVVLMVYATLIFKQNHTLVEALSIDIRKILPDGMGETLFYLTLLTFIIVYIRHSALFMGQNIVRNYVRGKYHRPISEKRIFLFVDLKSSTAFAEKLGHIKYSELIQEIYASLDIPVLATKGELYQYVGDEFVMIWELPKGIENNNCVNFYFQFEQAIMDKKEYFFEKFGLVPEFKAGLHYGEVSIAEIGSIKKDIAYHGDPINTTSRIMNKCKELKENIVISADLLSLLDNLDDEYQINSLGIQELRGKKNVIGLFSIGRK